MKSQGIPKVIRTHLLGNVTNHSTVVGTFQSESWTGRPAWPSIELAQNKYMTSLLHAIKANRFDQEPHAVHSFIYLCTYICMYSMIY